MAIILLPKLAINCSFKLPAKFERIRIFLRYFCKEHKYVSSVLLPKFTIPAEVTGSQRALLDREIHKNYDFDSLYNWQMKNNVGPTFILHDGPPYANGDLHLGHAINKILKDITNRFKVLQGRRVHYVPGWDCHGLPIEQKALKSGEKDSLSTLEIRRIARNFAEKEIRKQQTTFEHWGIMADWKNKYLTMSPDYVANQLKIFWKLYNKGFIFRDFKPVFWSPSNKTALAEAEIEYQEMKSLSVFLEFEAVSFPDFLKPIIGENKIALLAWTTTPWTLPANQAIAFNSNFEYCLIKSENWKNYWIVCKETISNLQLHLNTRLEIKNTFPGELLKDFKYIHPFNIDEHCPLLNGDFVEMEKGTGLVHCAPNHGFEDFKLIENENITKKKVVVDENGRFLDSQFLHPELRGLDVLSDGNEKVLSLLSSRIVGTLNYKHQYPHDWRSKKALIIRATQQWFFDVQKIKTEIKACLKNVAVIPSAKSNALESILNRAPQWCISRQRSWGVPIPVFYHPKSGQTIISEQIIDHLCQLLEKYKNFDFWWELPVDELLPKNVLEKSNLSTNIEYVRSSDILDIWFDSGISWSASNLPGGIADIYLEGQDQFRGWFQSSLVTSFALTGKAPYKSLFVHGFAILKKGEKMSKSSGNIGFDPNILTNGDPRNYKMNPAYGVDTLRFLVAKCGSSDTQIDKTLIEMSYKQVKKIRSVLRFIFGNLNDFNFEKDACPFNEMKPIDKFTLHSLNEFNRKVYQAYDSHKFGQAALNISDFVVWFSSVYSSSIKDRLYCDSKMSLKRRSCQTVLHLVSETLLSAIAPVLPHLAEEVSRSNPKFSVDQKLFEIGWKKANPNWDLPSSIKEAFLFAETLRLTVNRVSSQIKMYPKNLHTLLVVDSNGKKHLRILQEEEGISSFSDLCYFLQVASVQVFSNSSETSVFEIPPNSLIHEKGDHFELFLFQCEKKVCERCLRRLIAENEEDALCRRCRLEIV